ncbi:MAG TPA: hypothetical protein VED87_03445, partial [Methylocystis sp.]|nr:hypothetical protein [Methylocystis sp.]
MAGRNAALSASSAPPPPRKDIVGRRGTGFAVAVLASSVLCPTASAVGGNERLVASEIPAPSSEALSEEAELTLTRELADYAKWQSARACVNDTSGCAAARCYDDYLAEAPPPRAHAEQALSARARVLQSCSATAAHAAAPVAPIIPAFGARDRDGRYLARSRGGCGTKPSSVTLTIAGAAITWSHEFQGQAYEWRGAIDA